MQKLEKYPPFDASGIFIAESDGKPVEIVTGMLISSERKRRASYGGLPSFLNIRDAASERCSLKRLLKV